MGGNEDVARNAEVADCRDNASECSGGWHFANAGILVVGSKHAVDARRRQAGCLKPAMSYPKASIDCTAFCIVTEQRAANGEGRIDHPIVDAIGYQSIGRPRCETSTRI